MHILKQTICVRKERGNQDTQGLFLTNQRHIATIEYSVLGAEKVRMEVFYEEKSIIYSGR